MTDIRERAKANAVENSGARTVDMKFEIVVIPVSDVDRAKDFYAKLGWRLDADYDSGKDFRVIQFTPPGSGCSVIFGKNVTAAAPGSAQGLYLIVSDIAAARKELLGRGVEISEVFHDAGGVYAGNGRALFVWAATGERCGSRASQLPLVRLVQRSRRQRLAAAGDHHPAARAHRPRDRPRSRRRTIWRARFGARKRPMASTRSASGSRRELARLVRRLHGGGLAGTELPS